MIASMTGFALKNLTITKDDGSPLMLTMSLKSLNSRYFETNCKLPTALQSIEIDFIKKLKEKLIRGHVTLNVHSLNPNSFKGRVMIDSTLLKSYAAGIDQIKKATGITSQATLSDFLALPGIFGFEEHSIDEPVRLSLLKAFDELIAELLAVRHHEGKTLYKDLQERIEKMGNELQQLKVAAHNFMQEKKKKISEKISALQNQSGEFAETQRSALYFELDKIDIHEELVRFQGHLETLHAALNSADKEKGRRIDFILQEMAREVNTITAKCSDATISLHAINIKVELEKAREQVQNVV